MDTELLIALAVLYVAIITWAISWVFEEAAEADLERTNSNDDNRRESDRNL